MGDARSSWSSLPLPWQRAFEAAWASWREGSAGVGAVVTDSHGAIIGTGENRVMGPTGGPGPLSGTAMAHAEMNALASLPVGAPTRAYRDHALYTSFEPCFMCTATTVGTYGIPLVAFASYDPTWDGLHEALRRCAPIASRLPERRHLGGPYGALAYVIHVTAVLQHWPARYEPHERLAPDRMALCRRLVERGTLTHLRDGDAGVVDVAASIWDDLERLAS